MCFVLTLFFLLFFSEPQLPWNFLGHIKWLNRVQVFTCAPILKGDFYTVSAK